MGDEGETSGSFSSVTAEGQAPIDEAKDQSSSLKEQTSETSEPSPSEVPPHSGFPSYPSLTGMDAASFGAPLFPAMYPAPFPGFSPLLLQDQHRQTSGIYLVPVHSFMGPIIAFPPGGLIPVTYSMPVGAASAVAENNQSGGSANQSDLGRVTPGEAREAEGLHQNHGAAPRDAQGQRQDPQRQVVRRFQVGFQLDLLLILKLSVVVFVFNQDGSKERLFLLLFLATLVYLYQTGVLAPLLRSLSQTAQRHRLPPPHPPAQAVQAQEAARPEEPGQELGNGENAQNVARQGPPAAAMQQPNGLGGPAVAVEDHAADHPRGLTWWGFVKEVQMIVVGFVTSLLPGFHHVD